MEKLTLKELAPYLPYRLRVVLGTTERDLTAVSIDSKYVFVSAYKGSRDKQMAGIESIKPILRPLSDLTIENMKDFSGGNFKRYSEDFLHSILETYKRDIKTQKISYNLMQPLIENHFDVFGLIDKNLAVPVTENFNPYK